MKTELRGGAHSKGTRGPTENLAAYNLYVQGRYHLNQRTEEGLRKAVEFFEKAIVEDAQYAHAYSGLADAYSLLGHYGVLPPAEVWTKAASNAAWAVLQDENSAEAHTSLAHVKSTQDWDWLGARTRIPASHRARSALSDGPSLVCHVLPGAPAGNWKRPAKR